MSRFGRIDIVVNNAAKMGVEGGDFWGGTLKRWIATTRPTCGRRS